jgi:hypothetical protein
MNKCTLRYVLCLALTIPLSGCVTAVVALNCATDNIDLSKGDIVQYSVNYQLIGPSNTETKQGVYECEVESITCRGGNRSPDFFDNSQVIATFLIDDNFLLEIDTPSCYSSRSVVTGSGFLGYDNLRIKDKTTGKVIFEGNYREFNQSAFSHYEFKHTIIKV